MGTEGSLTHYARELYAPDATLREEAARQIWLRFSDRLAGEVRRRLNAAVRRRTGEEDVVQSLLASFFAAGPGPLGPPRDRAELWRRLVRFTACKVANTAEYHHAARRDVRRDVPLSGDPTEANGHPPRAAEPADGRELDPSDAAAAREEFERLLGSLPEDLRAVFVMRLEGYSNAEVAAAIGRVERTVEMRMNVIRELLRPQLPGEPACE